jgi:hypothetical protein
MKNSPSPIINNYINHITFVIDQSSSMSGFKDQVVAVFDSQIQYLAQRSQELDQETRVTVYFFADKSNCIIYDKDVLRLPSLKNLYNPYGNTALIDSTLDALDDLSLIPQKYGNHDHLILAITDGSNNISNDKASILKNKIESLDDNWTIAVLVPNQIGVHEAKKFGFPAENIQVWDTTSRNGVELAGEKIKAATNNFMVARSKGIKGTKNLFQLDLSNLTTKKVETTLNQLNPNEYILIPIQTDAAVIKPIVESWTKKDYVKGSAYYQLVKPETVQAGKQICIQNKLNGKVFSGTNARSILNLPDSEIKINPTDHGSFNIFVQSTSVNRKLPRGTNLIVIN